MLRRRHLSLSVVGLTIAIVAIAIPPATTAQRSRPLFTNPPIVVSRNGRLHVDLVAAPATYTIGGHRFNGMLYNGAYIPPVCRVRAGDRVNVTLHNRLAKNTNFHFHGLDVSPLGNGDNVYLHIHAGGASKRGWKFHRDRRLSQPANCGARG
jgi:suppressor of ftsI